MGEINLKLDWATHEAAKYSVMNYHYSRRMPVGKLVKIGVWENSKFIGAVLFGDGLLGNTDTFLGVSILKVAELVRVALTKHETPVTRIIKIAIKLLLSKCPDIELLVSYADSGKGHHGGIYQAGNWVFTGSHKTGSLYKHKRTGKIYHDRSINKLGVRKIMGKYTRVPLISDCDFVERTIKHRYLMPLTNEMREKIGPMAKPYPKKDLRSEHEVNAPAFHTGETGLVPSRPLQTPLLTAS